MYMLENQRCYNVNHALKINISIFVYIYTSHMYKYTYTSKYIYINMFSDMYLHKYTTTQTILKYIYIHTSPCHLSHFHATLGLPILKFSSPPFPMPLNQSFAGMYNGDLSTGSCSSYKRNRAEPEMVEILIYKIYIYIYFFIYLYSYLFTCLCVPLKALRYIHIYIYR